MKKHEKVSVKHPPASVKLVSNTEQKSDLITAWQQYATERDTCYSRSVLLQNRDTPTANSEPVSWSLRLWEMWKAPALCCSAYWCMPCRICDLIDYLGTDLPYWGAYSLYRIRKEFRLKHNIQDSGAHDCCAVCCCSVCVTAQLLRQRQHYVQTQQPAPVPDTFISCKSPLPTVPGKNPFIKGVPSGQWPPPKPHSVPSDPMSEKKI